MSNETLIVVNLVVSILVLVAGGFAALFVKGVLARVTKLEHQSGELQKQVASLETMERVVTDRLRNIEEKIDQLLARRG